jgi:1,4-alpha-glucan branching enzyme
MPKAYLALVLHAHLPFVRHPEHKHFLEENWLFEGISETYLPLIRVFERLIEKGVKFRICVSVSPTLITMLRDPLLQDRYAEHLKLTIDLAHKEADRTRSVPEFHKLALMYLSLYERNLEDFTERHGRDLPGVLRRMRDQGFVDLITTSATHAFLPVLRDYPKGADAQVKVAVDYHSEVFGKRPRGFWLPECGYYPGLEELLEKHGLSYFFVDSHGIAYADTRPKYGVFAPVVCPNGVAAFGRDPEAARAVWSQEEGYPGDVSYREFYRDIGFDLPLDYIRPYILEGDIRINTGLKYHAITGRSEQKVPYDREEALRKVQEHADNFLYRQRKQAEKLERLLDRPPLIVAPFDAELFGHWWFEGPEWMEAVISRIASSETWLEMIAPEDYLKRFDKNQTATPSFSSWGDRGYASVWLDGSNDWIYPHMHKAIERMDELAHRFETCDGLRRRILNQAAREVMLMQASDWAFIMKTGTTVPYAVRRVREHISNFSRIYTDLLANAVDLEWLGQLEKRNNIFPEIDYRIFG